MIDEKSFGTYLNILCQTLQKKNRILDEILAINMEQQKLAKSEDATIDEFEDLLNKKAPLLEQIEKLDDGFELSYSRVKEGFAIYKSKFQSIIETMQKNIVEISEKTMVVQRLETQNRTSMQLKFTTMRKKIKDFNVSSKSVNNYYKNMSNAFNGEAHFMDKKK